MGKSIKVQMIVNSSQLSIKTQGPLHPQVGRVPSAQIL